jgi:hypothetical protein
MAGLLTLKQLSSIFRFKLVVAYICILLMVSFDVKMNACMATKTTPLPILSLFNPENTSRLSKPIKILDDIKKSERTTLGTVGSLVSGSGLTSDRITVNSANLGDAMGYLLAGTFFTATVAQTLYNWDSQPVHAFLSGLADRIVPKVFETEDTDTRRSDSYDNEISFVSSRFEKYCFKCNQRCSGFVVGNNDHRINKR